MKMINSVIWLSLILLPLFAVVSVVEAGPGGWKPIKDLTDPEVVAIAKFAVSEYNKQSKQDLVYDQVVEGKEQVVAGTKYDLIILAKNSDGSKKYDAVVWKKLSGVESLVSFKAV